MPNFDMGGVEQEFLLEFIKFFHGRLEKELMMLEKGESLQYLKEPIISAQIVLKSDDTEGVLVMRTDQEFLWQSHPERKYGEDLEREDFLDWAGEIVNRILGGMKNNLLARNISTILQAPEAKYGEMGGDLNDEDYLITTMEIGNHENAMEVRFALHRSTKGQEPD
ncbi:MAG: hypothetical protein ACOH5I_18175 [Oligoflexus sp.]